MSTHASIGIKEGNEVRSIYVHCDGYIQGVGVTLFYDYPDIEQVKRLINLGGMSALRDTVEDSALMAYAGRGEDLTIREYNFSEYVVKRNAGREEYNYLFDVEKGVWFVCWEWYDELEDKFKVNEWHELANLVA